MKKPRSTKYLHTVVLQETGSTVTKTVQLTLKQSAVSSAAARMNNRLDTPSSQSPTPPGSPSVLKVNVNPYSTHPCEVNYDPDIRVFPTMQFRIFSVTFQCANLRWPNTVFARTLADAIQRAHKDCKNKHAVDTAIILFAQFPLYLCYFSS